MDKGIIYRAGIEACYGYETGFVLATDYAALLAEAEALRDMNRRQARRVMEQESARIAAEARAERLAEALRLALDSHGIALMTDPPQDAWKARGVEAKARAAMAAEGREDA